MCGIFGVFNLNNIKEVDIDLAKSALEKMKHRGPDFRDVKALNDYTVLAHARLSIIDLNPNSNQPFIYKHLSLTFNGEIFNYIELRDELQGLGYSFETESDTEVLIVAYHHWGKECINKLNGMWAFVIYDEIKDSFFGSRDRFGIKPFNYSLSDDYFIFSSEIKSILHYLPELKRPNYNAIGNYCRESIGAQNVETWFQDILRLPPAHNFELTRSGDFTVYQYWNYPTKCIKDITEEDAMTEYKHLFEESIKIRMRSDVPIGATLSSGLDSSSVVSYIDKNYNSELNCYTASFPGFKGDEYSIAKRFSSTLDVDLHKVLSDYSNYTDVLSKLIYHLESGHSSPAVFPLYFITKEAKKKITVFLEGQGADELLGGYVDKTFIDFILSCLSSFQLRTAYNEMKAFIKIKSLKHSLLLFIRNNGHPKLKGLMRKVYGASKIYGSKLQNSSLYSFKNKLSFDSRLNRILAEQHQTGLVNLLHYGDAISMMHSLENRLPFMDYRLVEFGFKLPLRFKIRSGIGKYIQREAVKEILPDYILNNPLKMGFPSPLKEIFKEGGMAVGILQSKRLRERELFNMRELENVIYKHQSGEMDYSRLLYRLLSVELWFRNFIDSKQKQSAA